MPFIHGDLVVSQDDDLKDIFPDLWYLDKDLCYQGKDQVFTVPEGTVTDFATVPQFLQWLVPRTGRWNRAAIVHDFFCEELYFYVLQGTPKFSPVSSRDADGIFRRILREEGVPFVKRWLIWTGVRYGALFSEYRRKGISKDLPLMALLSVLFLPILLPATVGVTIGNIVHKVYDGISKATSWVVRSVLRK